MGSCLMRDYIQTQDAIIEELRRDVQELRRDVQHSDSVNQELRKEFNTNQEELRQLKNLLTQPKLQFSELSLPCRNTSKISNNWFICKMRSKP